MICLNRNAVTKKPPLQQTIKLTQRPFSNKLSVSRDCMGCSSSSVALVQSPGSDNADSKPVEAGLFNVRQKIIINRTWTCLSGDPTFYGTRVFLYIFGKYPFIKTLFPVLADLEGDQLVCNSNFKAHATRFMQAVSRSFTLLPYPEFDQI